MKNLFVFVLLAVVLLTTAQRFDNRNSLNQAKPSSSSNIEKPKSSVSCPEKTGRFPTRQCDSYIECADGVGEEKVCPEGLLFNANISIFTYPCQYPIDVDCKGREATQPAQPTDDCPHQYGYFRIGGPAECGQFKNCVDGHAYQFDCPEGLAFNEESYRCDWPDMVASCNAKEFLGFDCPPVEGPKGKLLLEEGIYRNFRSPRDCQRFFTCVNGSPRMYNCGEGMAFNDLIDTCDGIENVSGCSGSRKQETLKSSRIPVDLRFQDPELHTRKG